VIFAKKKNTKNKLAGQNHEGAKEKKTAAKQKRKK